MLQKLISAGILLFGFWGLDINSLNEFIAVFLVILGSAFLFRREEK